MYADNTLILHLMIITRSRYTHTSRYLMALAVLRSTEFLAAWHLHIILPRYGMEIHVLHVETIVRLIKMASEEVGESHNSLI